MKFNSKTTKELKEVLLQIIHVLSPVPEKKHSGLIFGQGGISLFFSHLYECYNKDEYLEVSIAHLEDCINSMNHIIDLNKPMADLGTGLAGLGYLVQNFIKRKLLSEDETAILEYIDPLIHNAIIKDLDKSNYDNLYGYMGMIKYFKLRGNLIEYINPLFTDLKKNEIFTNHIYDGGNSIKSINLGLGQGIPSIILFLVDIFITNPNNQIKRIIDGLFNFLESVKKEKPNSKQSFFPLAINEGNLDFYEKVAWSYGDLGIGYTYLVCGKVFNDDYLYQTGIKITTHATQKEITQTGIEKRRYSSQQIEPQPCYNFYDLGFTDGTCGITHMFHRIFQLTDLAQFESATSYWLDHTIASAKELIIELKTKEYQSYDVKTFYYDRGLFEGLAGVGMMILTLLEDETMDHWDNIYLTQNRFKTYNSNNLEVVTPQESYSN